MPRLTATTAAARRDHIIAAAMRCFFNKGFAATSVDDVCAEAKISKGAFYSHYASKDALIYAALAARSEELGPIEGETIAAVTDAIFDRQIAPTMTRENGRFGLEVLAASASDEVLRQGNIRNLENLREQVQAAFERLAEMGVTRPGIDAGKAAAVVQRFLLGAVVRNAIWDQEAADEIRGSLRLLVDSLIAPLE